MNYGSLSLQLAEAGLWPKLDGFSYAGSIHQLVRELNKVVVSLFKPGDLDHSKCKIGRFGKDTRDIVKSIRGSELDCHRVHMEVRGQWDFLRNSDTEEK